MELPISDMADRAHSSTLGTGPSPAAEQDLVLDLEQFIYDNSFPQDSMSLPCQRRIFLQEATTQKPEEPKPEEPKPKPEEVQAESKAARD